MNPKWTDKDDDLLRTLAAKGLRSSEIGAVMKRSKGSIIGRSHRIGVPLLWTYTRTVENVVLQSPKAWTAEDKAKCCQMRLAGSSLAEIGGALDRSKDAIRRLLQKAGIKFAQPRKPTIDAPKLSAERLLQRYVKPKTKPIRPTTISAADMAFGEGGGVTIDGLTNYVCRWPIGDPREDGFRYCGDAVSEGRHYCAVHHGVAYVGKTSGVSPERRAYVMSRMSRNFSVRGAA